MKKPRKPIVEIATSADGYIARLDGDVSWLDRPQPKGHYGMGAFMKSIDTILWGRKTYTKGIEMGMKDGGFGPKIKNYVFSRQPQRFRIQNYASGSCAWVQDVCVNTPGDTEYHGPKGAELLAIVEAREAKKAAQQMKANKLKEKARRFHR
jgi:hypothetical protein